jgi:drug/metabolite transporter (DMT)-like permease
LKQAYFKYIFSLLLFGSNGVVASYIALTSYQIVFLRSLLGSILLIAIFFFTGHKLTALKYKKDFFFIALSGIAMGANWLFLFEAFAQIGVSLGTLINYCGPTIIVALSPLLFKESITAKKLIALLATLIGVFLISGQTAMEDTNFWGFLCAGLSAVSYSAMVIFNKKSKQIKGMENATLQLFFTFITVAIFIFFKQGFNMDIAAGSWLPILWIGLINTGISCYLYFSSMGHLPVQTVAIFGYLEPLSAVLFSALFLREVLQPIQVIGAILIIGGAVFAEEIFKLKKVQNSSLS